MVFVEFPHSCFSTLYGSISLEHEAEIVEALLAVFQYPLRVEFSLEPGYPGNRRNRTTGFSTLYGSNLIGTQINDTTREDLRGFSTLYGSNLIGTAIALAKPIKNPTFQYPLRVEFSLEPRPANRLITISKFQYPLRVESHWNFDCAHPARLFLNRFSTLYGRNLIGTSPGCLRLWWESVSVPSTGRISLEPG